MSSNEGIEFTEPDDIQPTMHPTDKRFLVSIIFCLLVGLGLVAWQSNHRQSQLEASLTDMQIKLDALIGFRAEASGVMGHHWLNLTNIASSAASRVYVDRVAKAVEDLQRWRLELTYSSSNHGGIWPALPVEEKKP